MIKILAICKRSTFLHVLHPLLSIHNIELVSICNNPAEATSRYNLLQPDIVLMDANWSHPIYSMSGPSLIQSLTACDPTVSIIVTTTLYDSCLLNRMKMIGIKGYFTKTGTDVLQSIINCINTVHDGGEYYYQEKTTNVMLQ